MESKEAFVEGLTDILVKHKVVNSEEARALKIQFYERSKEAYDDFLLSEGLVSTSELLNALSDYYKVPAFDVVGYFFDHFLVTRFPKDLLRRYAMIPVEVEDEEILIMVATNPDNEEMLPLIGDYVSYDVQFMVGLRQDVIDAINEFYDEAITVVNPDEDLNEEHEEEREVHEIEEFD